MQIVYVNAQNLQQIQQSAPDAAIALGYFDGVHLGHQKVIQSAKEQANSRNLSLAVLSFFPHPKSVLFPDKEVVYLEPLEQKAEKLEFLGVDIFYVVEFTKELAKVEPESFLDDYILGLNAEEIICGFDYTYGAKAKGTVAELAAYADRKELSLTVVEELKWEDEKISSTLIRHHLLNRKLNELPKLLGTYHQTKHCKKNGLLPNYSLPGAGSYKVRIKAGNTLIDCVATVKCKKSIQLEYETDKLPDVLTIQWISQLQMVSS